MIAAPILPAANCQLRLQSNDSVTLRYIVAQSAQLTANNFERSSTILFTCVKKHTITASSLLCGMLSMGWVLLKSTGLFFMDDIWLTFAVLFAARFRHTRMDEEAHLSHNQGAQVVKKCRKQNQ